MLIEFKFSNYRSFRDETVLSMEASGFNPLKKCLIKYHSNHKRTNNPLKIIPVAAIYGKNGGGKMQCNTCFLVGCSIYQKRSAHATRKSFYSS